MNKTASLPKERLVVVDALRGFAVFAILMVHCMEHFMYFVYPKDLPNWMNILDKGVNDTIFTLFAGKSYAIFSVLFGLTFFIQTNSQLQKGKDFGYRFLWRLLLLIVFASLNAIVFPGGDVLLLYVCMGLVLFITRKWSSKQVLALAVVMLLQPYEWIQFLMRNPLGVQMNHALYNELTQVASTGSFMDFLTVNLITGQKASLLWALENGRLFQTGGLFLLGMLIGRQFLFKDTESNKRFWSFALVISAVLFAPLFQLSKLCSGTYAGVALDMWQKLAFTVVLISSFVTLYWNLDKFKNFVSPLVPYGRMSLTNYISQSYIGMLLLTPFGLNLAPVLGHTATLLMGFGIFALQLWFSKRWMGSYRFGPLEGIWHKATWIGYDKQSDLGVQKA